MAKNLPSHLVGLPEYFLSLVAAFALVFSFVGCSEDAKIAGVANAASGTWNAEDEVRNLAIAVNNQNVGYLMQHIGQGSEEFENELMQDPKFRSSDYTLSRFSSSYAAGAAARLIALAGEHAHYSSIKDVGELFGVRRAFELVNVKLSFNETNAPVVQKPETEMNGLLKSTEATFLFDRKSKCLLSVDQGLNKAAWYEPARAAQSHAKAPEPETKYFEGGEWAGDSGVLRDGEFTKGTVVCLALPLKSGKHGIWRFVACGNPRWGKYYETAKGSIGWKIYYSPPTEEEKKDCFTVDGTADEGRLIDVVDDVPRRNAKK